MFANFNETQFVDAGNGKFGIKLSLPAVAPFADLGMVQKTDGWWLPHYETGIPPAAGDYWLIIRPDGTSSVLGLSERPVNQLGAFGFFSKQDGVAFVTPHNEPWPTSSFGYVYARK